MVPSELSEHTITLRSESSDVHNVKYSYFTATKLELSAFSIIFYFVDMSSILAVYTLFDLPQTDPRLTVEASTVVNATLPLASTPPHNFVWLKTPGLLVQSV